MRSDTAKLAALGTLFGAALWIFATDDGAGSVPAMLDDGAVRAETGPPPPARTDPPAPTRPLRPPPTVSTPEEAAPEDGSDRLPGFAGRIAWRGSGLPVAGVPLRMTETWLDTLLPSEAEDARRAREGAPLLLDYATETDARGRFWLPRSAGGKDLFLLIDPGGPAADLHMLSPPIWANDTFELGTILLDARGAVTGRVVGADGEGLGGLQLRVVDLPLHEADVPDARRQPLLNDWQGVRPGDWSPRRSEAIASWLSRRDELLPFAEARTDADGTFRLPHVRPGKQRLLVQLVAQTTHRETWVQPGETTDVGDIVVPSGREIELLVADASSEAVEGVDISAVSHELPLFGRTILSLRPRVRTDARGRARLAGLGPGPERIMVRRQPGGPWEEFVLPGAKGERLYSRWRDDQPPILRRVRQDSDTERSERAWRIYLSSPPGGEITVSSRRRAPPTPPPAGSSVRIYSTVETHPDNCGLLPSSMQPVQESPGVWQLGAIPRGSYVAVATAPGHQADRHEFQVPFAAFTLYLLPLQQTRITVVDEHDEPVAGATLSSRPLVKDWRHGVMRLDPTSSWRSLGRTDEEGIFAWPNREATDNAVVAEHPGHAPSAVKVSRDGAQSAVSIVLRRSGSMRGALRDRHETPVAHWWITASPSTELRARLPGFEWLPEKTARTAADGTFSLQGLAPGAWILRAERPGDQRNLQFQRGLDELVREAARAGASRREQSRYRDALVRWMWRDIRGMGGRLHVDRSGLSVADPVPTVAAEKTVWIQAGVTVHVDLPIQTRDDPFDEVAVAGRVQLDGGPGPGLVVRLQAFFRPSERNRPYGIMRAGVGPVPEKFRLPWERRTRLDPSGAFTFVSVPPGSYTLELRPESRGPNALLWSTELQLPDDSARDLRIEVTTGSVLATVRDAAGRGVANRPLMLEQVGPEGHGGARVRVVTDARGQVDARGLPTGDYRLQTDDLAFEPERIAVRAGHTTYETLEARRRPAAERARAPTR